MDIFLLILLVIFGGFIILVMAMHPVRSQLTKNELTRRAKKTKAYKKELQRYEAYPVILVVLRTLQAVLHVLFISLSIALIGWWWGVVLSVVFVLLSPVTARWSYARQLADYLYAKIETPLLDLSPRAKKIFLAFRLPAINPSETTRHIHSREDLAELIEHSPDVIGTKERVLLGSALSFFDKKVSEVMTPRTVIDFIKKSEFLGPLVLDELHLLGHSRLPVIDGDIDHVVGVLHLRNLLSLNTKTSATAEEMMEKQVFYIREDDSLEHALAGFIKTRHHLFIVINKNRETVGLLTLEDVMEALIGRRIVDEDDVYDDLRAVAEKEGVTNNAPINHTDI